MIVRDQADRLVEKFIGAEADTNGMRRLNKMLAGKEKVNVSRIPKKILPPLERLMVSNCIKNVIAYHENEDCCYVITTGQDSKSLQYIFNRYGQNLELLDEKMLSGEQDEVLYRETGFDDFIMSLLDDGGYIEKPVPISARMKSPDPSVPISDRSMINGGLEAIRALTEVKLEKKRKKAEKEAKITAAREM